MADEKKKQSGSGGKPQPTTAQPKPGQQSGAVDPKASAKPRLVINTDPKRSAKPRKINEAKEKN